jgi:hypothetical protein
VEHCIFKNCTFIGERGSVDSRPEIEITKKAPYYHGHLEIIDCTFECEEVVYYRKSEKLTFWGNKNTLGKDMYIIAEGVGEIIAQPNVQVRKVF